MKYNRAFWDTTWSKSYGRYNSHHQAVWDAILPFLKGKVVDIGCGPCVIYKEKNINLMGVDISEQALVEAKKNYPNGTYVCADAIHTGLEDSSFDTVIMLGLLDYFEDWTPVLKEAERICKNDGKILATLLDGFEGHDWKNYKFITSNWYLYEHRWNLLQ